ncbi:MAG: hypothetical protein HY721_10015 [Planctomycetes bacterium]|nr:hypothetical protein [Planctomycetota bacterium]
MDRRSISASSPSGMSDAAVDSRDRSALRGTVSIARAEKRSPLSRL